MLFNTLAYAQFFAIVFVVAWLLVDRRVALALPWFVLLAFAAVHPSLSAFGFTGIAGVLTAALIRRATAEAAARRTSGPSPRLAAVSLAVSLIPLTFLTLEQHGLDPFSHGLELLGVPVGRLGVGSWALFVLGVVATYFLVCARKVRLLFILGASYVFYAHWDWRFLPLIWGSSTADFFLARAIHNAKTPRSKRIWLIGTVMMNLGVLGFFKYFNFGVDTLQTALGALSLPTFDAALRVALPIGISFFTFESMSYVIDVYRGEIEPDWTYSEYLSFVAFFPHLVAGPIVRPRDLLPQLAGPPRFNAHEASEGLFLIALGLTKKIAIGDYLALNLVDRVFDAPLMYSSLEVYAATLGYALQIYCDFSGYTDIAIGSALLLGIRFPLNFNSPYKAHNVVDFWRRWHISLSTWLRDYLYIPLGGNREGHRRTYLNLFITMVLGGLWHGAAWTFVVWGALHGAALAANKWFAERLEARRLARLGQAETKAASPAGSPIEPEPAIAHEQARAEDPHHAPPAALVNRAHPPSPPRAPTHPWIHAAKVLLTFHFVCACWIFFRSGTFDEAQLVYFQLSRLTTHHPNLAPSVLAVLAIGILGHYVPERLFVRSRETFVRMPAPLQGIALFAVAVVLRRMASTDAVPFVYFQF